MVFFIVCCHIGKAVWYVFMSKLHFIGKKKNPCCCSNGKSFWYVRRVNCCSLKNAARNLRIAYKE